MGFLSDFIVALKGRKVASNLIAAAHEGDFASVQAIITSDYVRRLHLRNRGELLSVGLYEAASEGYAEIVLSLLEEGAEIDRPYPVSHDTALIVAAFKGWNAIVELLIDFGADLDRSNAQGITPLMLAAAKCSERVVMELLEAGADAQLRSPDGMTAADFADFENRHGIAQLLRLGAT